MSKERTMRAKMEVLEVLKKKDLEVLKMRPVSKTGDYPEDGSDEDNTFALFSPSGELTLYVSNPALFGKLLPADKFYVDFTRVEAAAVESPESKA